MSKNQWSNKFSFIITTSAFAIGLGNIWRFPYIAGEGGGAAFILVYLILMFLVGIPILTIEMALGRMSKTTILIGFEKLAKKYQWNSIGWLGTITCILIMGFYIMIMAWIVIYLWECFSGKISKLSIPEITGHFDVVASNLSIVITVILTIMLAVFFVVRQGLKNGLERYSKGMMFGLIILMIGLCVWAATLDGAAEGYHWLLSPDFSKINFRIIMSALGQLFFSVGVGMAVAFVFGSYTHKNENLIKSTIWIIIADTFFAFLAGLMLFPAIFSFNLQPDSGPNLIFVTMATVFNQLEYGWAIGTLFFLLLFLAGFTSLISCVQGLKDTFKDKYSLSDTIALLVVISCITAIAILAVFSYSDNPFLIFGKTVFETLDYTTSTLLLPLSGLLIVVFAGHIVGFDRLKSHLITGLEKITIKAYWKVVLLWILPFSLLIILINGLLNT
ncbi:Sodium- and chloride-dependent GABA transporter [Flagellimonas maritima]|uniref:Sodium-and chloride-dependent GABA transporter n=1 Tax=Flagellimonas maritima TaxID=1383885 RepID=A0A2Z4LP21_9FLAO|nr:sodium-dependent transporter [Allomuricauda aurantiaca]AWX43513.1 Sodium- and chloride-dependent GABA transporter [Allomuricauda aurantiaca]